MASNTVAGKPRQSAVNKMTPAASKAKLGDVVADLVAKHNALLAKLDLDAGVTDTNYKALHAVTDMESR